MKLSKIHNKNKNLGDQFRDLLLRNIKNNEWLPNEKLPSLRTLATETGISIGIVRKVISELSKDGCLTQHQGKGVFISPPMNASNYVAVVLPAIQAEHIAHILTGIKSELCNHNTGLLLEFGRNDFLEETALVGKLDKTSIAGAIIYPPPVKSFRRNLIDLQNKGIPFVLVNTSLDGKSFNAVSVDYFKMGELAISHLLECGHTKIGFLGYKSQVQSFDELYNGMEYKLNQYQLSFKDMPQIISEQPSLNQSLYSNPSDNIIKLLDGNPETTVVLTMDENAAVEAYLSLKKANIKIPKEISLMTFGDLSAFYMTDPPITAITQPYEEMGRLSVQSLFNILRTTKNKPFVVYAQPILKERKSLENITRSKYKKQRYTVSEK